MRRAAGTVIAAVLFSLLPWAATGCAKNRQLRPEPTDEQWEKAMVEPPVADTGVKKNPGPEPKLVFPADGARIEPEALAYDQGVIVFTWTESTPDSVYTVEVAVDPNFTKIILRKIVPRNSVAYRMHHSGNLFWRVRTDAGVQSNVHSFEVRD